MTTCVRNSLRQPRAGRRMSEVQTQLVMDTVKNIISSTGTDQPFYVADLSDVVYKYRYWRSKLPRVEPFYAVKCNSDPMLLRLMVALGMRFDCASKGEIDAVFSAGAKPSDIIYAHPFKSNSFLRYAASVGVDLMTFDCEAELHKIKRVYPNARCKVLVHFTHPNWTESGFHDNKQLEKHVFIWSDRLVLRIEIPNVPAGFPLSKKFGCEMRNTLQLLQLAKNLGLNVVGVSFHVGSLCEMPSAFAKAITMARQVFDFAEDLGFHFTLLDVGGGYPGSSNSYDVYDKMCYYINQSLEEHFPEGCGVRIIAEPGCYMVCSAFSICTKIVGRKVQETDAQDNDGYGKKKKISYYLNDGIYGSFAYGFEKYGYHMKPLLSKSQLASRPMVSSKLWGITCCSSDCILDDCLLPDMEVGEYILFDNMGAYTSCLTTNFNGFPMPNTNYIFPPQTSYRNDKLPPLEDFCRELGSHQLKAIIKIQDFICHDDSNDDLFRKG